MAPKRTATGLSVAVVAVAAGVATLCGASASEETFCNVARPVGIPSGAIAWTYSLVDDDRDRLERARGDLELRGLKFDGYGQGPCWPCDSQELRMSETAHHTRESLRVRETMLCEVATQRQLETYWGATPSDPLYWDAYWGKDGDRN